MTTHYINITLLPDPEFSPAHLLSALVAKLHRALVQLKADDIGISFPQYSLHPRTLGSVLRLHGTESALQRLMDCQWLQGMRDHVKVTEACQVPVGATLRLVERRQFKTSAQRMRRRRMRRKGESAEQAAAAIPDTVERKPSLPFVQLLSHSTGQRFCLFIEQTPVESEEGRQRFNTYGLGLGSPIPWF